MRVLLLAQDSSPLSYREKLSRSGIAAHSPHAASMPSQVHENAVASSPATCLLDGDAAAGDVKLSSLIDMNQCLLCRQPKEVPTSCASRKYLWEFVACWVHFTVTVHGHVTMALLIAAVQYFFSWWRKFKSRNKVYQ